MKRSCNNPLNILNVARERLAEYRQKTIIFIE